MVAQYNKYAYTYDTAGNITEITGMDAGISAETTDALLKNQTTAEGTIAISVSMTYDKDNRLLSYNNNQVEYDANGNMTKGPLNGAMADFAYDCRNRLVKVTEADGTVTTYEYDAEDIRIASTTGNIRTEYTTDRQSAYSQTLIRTDYEKSLLGTGKKVKEKTIYTYGLGLINERRNAGEQYYYHYNHIGSTMAVSDGSGEVLYRFVYDTYGELSDIKTDDGISLKNSEIASEKTKDYTVEELAHAAGLTYLYNGQFGVATDQNGLYYMRARYYDQDIKRFINRDIVSGDITNSKSLNRYTYVQGNPVSLTDPFGLCPDSNSSVRLIRTFLCDTDWSRVGHTALGVVGMFWDGADLINAVWYAAEGNTEMALSSALCLIPLATGGTKLLSMGKLSKYGKTISVIGQTVLGITGTIAGISIIQVGFGNFLDGLSEGRVDGKSLLMMFGGAIITGISTGSLYGTLTTAAKAADTACVTAPKGEKPTILDSNDLSGKPLTDEELKALGATGSGRAGKGGSQTINPNEIRFSQSSVNGSDELVKSMKKNGWAGDPIDIVIMPDGGYTTIDNTRVVAARQAGIDVQANVHAYSDSLPAEYIDRFTTKKGIPETWGDAISLRIGKQNSAFRNNNPFGSLDMYNIK